MHVILISTFPPPGKWPLESRDGSTDLALGWTRREGRAAEQWQHHNLPRASWRGRGTSGASPFQWDFISHHVLQGWRKLLKPWGVLSPPVSCDSCAQVMIQEGLLSSAYNHQSASLLEFLQSPGSRGLMAEVTLGWVGEGLWVCFRSCPDCQKLCAVRKKKTKKKTTQKKPTRG